MILASDRFIKVVKYPKITIMKNKGAIMSLSLRRTWIYSGGKGENLTYYIGFLSATAD